MKKRALKHWLRWRGGLAVAGGVCWGLAFPEPGFAGLAWCAPALMLLAAAGARPSQAFGLGYLAGLAHYLVSLRWLLYNPFPAGAVAGWLALSAYLALYPALWVWLCWRLVPSVPSGWSGGLAPRGRASAATATAATAAAGQDDTPPPTPAAASLWTALGRLAQTPWALRTLWCLACAAAWVALELARGRLLTGFPWNFLGVSQYRALPLIQIASAAGVYAVSFLVAWGAVALFCGSARLAARLRERPVAAFASTRRASAVPRGASLAVSFRFAMFTDLGLPLLAVVLVMFQGGARLSTPATTSEALTVALVQPSIPQRLIFDPLETTNRFNALMDLSRLALAARPDLLVWPEASLPGFEESHYQALTNLIASHHVWMIFGADDVENRAAPGEPEAAQYYNSAFLFDPQGEFVATYRKQRLVIFGEYVPLMGQLPFLKWLTPIHDSFTPGKGPVPFVLKSPAVKTSVLICFEDVFPHLARRHVSPDLDFLLNLTNNGWFGESAAQWQHAANAVFRALENGVPLVRCANNGLTCWVDPLGRIHDVGVGEPGGIYAAGFRVVRIPLRSAHSASPATLYQRQGDWFGWACVLATLGAILFVQNAKRRQRAA